MNGGLLTAARVDESAQRVLQQKFELGLFENPYVDPARASTIAGNKHFVAIGDKAQAKSLTLLTNEDRILPVKAHKAGKVYLSGVSADVATARGLDRHHRPGAGRPGDRAAQRPACGC